MRTLTISENKLEDLKKGFDPTTLKYFAGAPVQIAAICLALGLDIESKPMAYSGSIQYHQISNKFIISVNQSHSVEHRRLTVAHELSHYFLHKEEIEAKSVLYDEPLRRDENYQYSHLERAKEIAANNLAAEMLMPKKQLEQRYDDLLELFGRNEEDTVAKILASEYWVSISAMRIRLGLPVD